MLSASQYHPITDLYFESKEVVDCQPGGPLLKAEEPPLSALHIFNWSSKSFLTVELSSGQTITYPPTSLVEGAIYYVKIKKVIAVGPNAKETQVMGLSTVG